MTTKTKRSTRPTVHFDDFLLDVPPSADSAEKQIPRAKLEQSLQGTPQSPDSSIQAEIELEQLRNKNLKLDLQIKQAQLEIAKLDLQKKDGKDPISSPVVDNNAVAATTFLQEAAHSTTQEWLQDMDFPSLADLRGRKKQTAHSLLPRDHLFTSKGKVDFDKLDISEFVVGYLEMLKVQKAESHPFIINVLKIVMEKATIYTWSSVKNFYLAVATAIEHRRFSWNSPELIQERATSFFTHADLRGAHPVRQNAGNNNAKQATATRTPSAKIGITTLLVRATKPRPVTRKHTNVASARVHSTPC